MIFVPDKQEQILLNFRNLFEKMSWLNTLKMKNSLKSYKSSEVHCIEYIEKNTDVNVTKLAEAFYMTKGAITKVTQKLMDKNVIESYQKKDNKKEIYFRLTSKGKEVFEVHEKLHDEIKKRDSAVFESMSNRQFEDILRFMEDYSRHLDSEIENYNKAE